MIKANELRIGNWVKFYNELVTVLALQDGKISYWVDKTGFPDIYVFDDEDKYEGIPLTEILEGCGFKWDSDEIGDSLAESYVLNKFVWSVGLKEMYFKNTPLPHIEYLHQFQNLYFDLNGDELEVNLKLTPQP